MTLVGCLYYPRCAPDTICTVCSKSPGLIILEETITGIETLHGSRSLEKYLAQGQKDAIDCQ
jgi:hypothetical protein